MPVATASAPGLADRLTLVVQALRNHVFPRLAKASPDGPLLLYLHGWLGRLVPRLERLLARARAGTLADPPLRPRAPRPAAAPDPRAGPSATPPPATRRRLRLPARHAWLLAQAPELGQVTARLELLLADPDLQALLALAPRSCSRVLRPLCRAIGAIPPTPLARLSLRLPWAHDPPEFRRQCRGDPRPAASRSAPRANPIATPAGPPAIRAPSKRRQ